jgi:hypothetical protein
MDTLAPARRAAPANTHPVHSRWVSFGAWLAMLKTPLRNGTTHLVVLPVEFMQRLLPSSRHIQLGASFSV